jgi:hypothetical protein
VPRKLTATTGVLLALAFAGCGKDEPDTAAQSAATTTTPAATTPAATTPAKGSKTTKTTASKGAVSKATDAQTTTTKKPAATTATTAKKPATATTSTTPKKAVTTKTTPTPSVTPSKTQTDLTSGTGAGPTAERLDVVVVLRRYYKAFADKDGAEVCSLLTDSGKKVMITDGGAKSCADSAERLVATASPDNIALLARTRDGLHVDDVTVNGDSATAQIGKTSYLRLTQEGGRWLVRSPNVSEGKP